MSRWARARPPGGTASWPSCCPTSNRSRLAEKYNFDYAWYRAGTVGGVEVYNGYVAQEKIPVYRCPTSPGPPTVKYGSASVSRELGISDYAICRSVNTSGSAWTYLVSIGLYNVDDPRPEGLLRPITASGDFTLNASDVTDGTSHTYVFTEDAGRPEFFARDGTTAESRGLPINPATGDREATGAAWADRDQEYVIHNQCLGGKMLCCHNDNEIFSFHIDGANFSFADGSSKFVEESVDPRVLIAIMTPDGGERLRGDDL